MNTPTLSIALVVVAGTIFTALISGWQQRRSKAQDYARQDAVAEEALRQQEVVAVEAKRQQDAVAAQVAEDRRQSDLRADEVAKLLLAAQTKQAGAATEVARLAAGDPNGVGSLSVQVCVTLSYPNGNRKSVILADVPRVGENIRLSNGADDPWLLVDHVLWMEGTTPPHVILTVHHLEKTPMRPKT